MKASGFDLLDLQRTSRGRPWSVRGDRSLPGRLMAAV